MLLTRKDFSGPLKFGLSGFHCIEIRQSRGRMKWHMRNQTPHMPNHDKAVTENGSKIFIRNQHNAGIGKVTNKQRKCIHA
jgi:hypothetical protein